jgi:hypothetical protein
MSLKRVLGILIAVSTIVCFVSAQAATDFAFKVNAIGQLNYVDSFNKTNPSSLLENSGNSNILLAKSDKSQKSRKNKKNGSKKGIRERHVRIMISPDEGKDLKTELQKKPRGFPMKFPKKMVKTHQALSLETNRAINRLIVPNHLLTFQVTPK